MNIFNYEDINIKKSRVNYHYLLDPSHLISNIKNTTEFTLFLEEPSITNTNNLFNMIFNKIFLFATDYTNIFDIEHNSITNMLNPNLSRNLNMTYSNEYLSDFNLIYTALKYHCILHGYFTELNTTCNELHKEALIGSRDAYNNYTYSYTKNNSSPTLKNPKTYKSNDPYAYIAQTYNLLYKEIENTYVNSILDSCSIKKDAQFNKFFIMPMCYKEISHFILTNNNIKSFVKKLNQSSENTPNAIYDDFISVLESINQHLTTYTNYNDLIISYTFFEKYFAPKYSKFILDYSQNHNFSSLFNNLNSNEIISNYFSLALDCPIVFFKDLLMMYSMHSKSANQIRDFFNIVNNVTIPLLEDLWDIVIYDLFNSQDKYYNIELLYTDYISNKYTYIINSPYNLIITVKKILDLLFQTKDCIYNINKISEQLRSFYATININELKSIILSIKEPLKLNDLDLSEYNSYFNSINDISLSIDEEVNTLFTYSSIEPNTLDFDFKTIIESINNLSKESSSLDTNYYLNKEPFIQLIKILDNITYYPDSITYINELITYSEYIQQIIYSVFCVPKDPSLHHDDINEKISDMFNNSYSSKIVYLIENVVKYYIGVENSETSIHKIIRNVSKLLSHINNINFKDLVTPINHIKRILPNNDTFQLDLNKIINDSNKLLKITKNIHNITSTLLSKKREQKKSLQNEFSEHAKKQHAIPAELNISMDKNTKELHVLNYIYKIPNQKLCKSITKNIKTINSNIKLIHKNIEQLSTLIQIFETPPININSDYIKRVSLFDDISKEKYSATTKDILCNMLKEKYTPNRFDQSLIDILTYKNQDTTTSDTKNNARNFLLSRISSLNDYFTK